MTVDTAIRWKASRYTARTQAADGGLVIYCSSNGAIAGVAPEEASLVRSALSRSTITEGPLEGVLQELAEAGFLVPIDTDEDQTLQNLRNERIQGGRTLHLILLPTEDCNFRCVYCYEQFKRHKMRRYVQDSVVEWFDRNANKYDNVFVEWFGGEPLHAADVVISLGKRLKDVAEHHGVVHISGMTTNGYNLTPTVMRQLLEVNCNTFTITLDGVKGEHDQHRVLADGSPTFDTIWKNILDLKATDLPFRVRIRHNFDPESLTKANEFLVLLSDSLGDDARFNDVNLRQIAKWGGPNDAEMVVCDARQGIDARYNLLNDALKMGFYEHALKFYLEPGGFVCYASNPNSLVIGADGKIMKCTLELDTEDRNIVGQVHRDGVFEIRGDKMAPWIMSGSGDGTCATCFMAPSCQGAACAKERFDRGIRPCPTDKKRIGQVLNLIYESEQLPPSSSSNGRKQIPLPVVILADK